jgi:RNA polymerase sigma factor (TIGR02999 family)
MIEVSPVAPETVPPKSSADEISSGRVLPDDDVIMQLAYDELKSMAHRARRGGASQTLNTTALVNETYLRLREHSAPLRDLEHLRALTARAMRHILVDHARAQRAEKRPGAHVMVTLDGLSQTPDLAPTFDLLDVDAALERLTALSPRLSEVVELHVFAGYAMPEIAKMLAINERTVFRDWRRARAFLTQYLSA